MSGSGSKGALASLLDLVDRPGFIVAPDGEILFGNAAAARLCGDSAEGLPGRSLPEALAVEDGGALLRRLRGDPGEEDADGSRHHLATIPASRGEADILVRALEPGRDAPRGVIVRVATHGPAHLAPAVAPFAQVAHELRQPVQAALGYAELLATGIFGSLSPEQEDAARRVHELVRRLARMLEDLLRKAGRDSPGA